jgi:hypothetical protein
MTRSFWRAYFCVLCILHGTGKITFQAFKILDVTIILRLLHFSRKACPMSGAQPMSEANALAEASAVSTPRHVIDYFGCVLLRCGRVMWLEKEATGR